MGTVLRARGFTLIEVLITVAILVLLAAIAIPNYTQYVVRTNRSEARQQLLEAAAFLQRVFTQTNQYPAVLPANFQQSPATGAARYTITLAQPNGNVTYLLTATPTGQMAGDACGALTLNQTGVRTSVGPLDTCWGR